MATSNFISASLAGRCANGYERDQGRRVHAVPHSDALERNYYTLTPALCGAKPGARSAGWSYSGPRPITCPRCLDKIERSEDNGADDGLSTRHYNSVEDSAAEA